MTKDALANISTSSTHQGRGNTNTNEQKGKIRHGELLQANVTVIAGVLIFLTISSATTTTVVNVLGMSIVFWTSVIVIPFGISSVLIIGVYGTARFLNIAKLISTIGFLYLIIILVALGYTQIYPAFNLPYFSGLVT